MTTTLVRAQDLEAVTLDVGEPCKMISNETKAARRILDFAEDDMDFVMVQFVEEGDCRKVKLDHLWSIQQ